MVLVRRKSDGLYYTNRGQSRSWRRKKADTGWTSDPQACKPFGNGGGARTAFNIYVPYNKCNCGGQLSPQTWRSRPCSPTCYRTRTARAAFDKLYVIVPVHVKVDHV